MFMNLGVHGLAFIQVLRLVGELGLNVDERLNVLLEIRAHHPLHRVPVETDDLRQHRRREHRQAAALFFKNDLQQNGARQVLVALRIDDLEIFLIQHELLDVRQRDVRTCLGVIQPTVRIFLDESFGSFLCSSGHLTPLSAIEAQKRRPAARAIGPRLHVRDAAGNT
jgi:hypothetical protein